MKTGVNALTENLGIELRKQRKKTENAIFFIVSSFQM